MASNEALELSDDSSAALHRRMVGPGLLERIAQAQLTRGAYEAHTGAQANHPDSKDQADKP